MVNHSLLFSAVKCLLCQKINVSKQVSIYTTYIFIANTVLSTMGLYQNKNFELLEPYIYDWLLPLDHTIQKNNS